MNNTTKKIIYVIKDDGNNHYDESIVSLHETKESAELSMATLESANTMRRFWIEEIDLFYLGKSNDELAQKLKIARKQRDELLRYNEEFRNEALICADCDAISKGKYDQAIKQRDRLVEALAKIQGLGLTAVDAFDELDQIDEIVDEALQSLTNPNEL